MMKKLSNFIINKLLKNEQVILFIGEIIDVRIKMYLDNIKSKLNQ